MSSSCTGLDCSNKLAEYKNGIDKLLKRLRDSEHQKSEYEILNLTLKQKLNRPSKLETKHFHRMFQLIQILIENCFDNKNNKEEIRDIFLGFVDSIWSLLAARYNDKDSWLDLKYLGTNIIETLSNIDLNEPHMKNFDDFNHETLLKKNEISFDDQPFNKNKLLELNKEVNFLNDKILNMHEKMLEQNNAIKNLYKNWSKSFRNEKNVTKNLISTNSSNNSSSVRSSSCSNEISSGSFNINSQLSSSSNERNLEKKKNQIPLDKLVKENTNKFSCLTCKDLCNARQNADISQDINNCHNQRKSSACTSLSSNSSSTNSTRIQASHHRRSSDNSKNYMIIQNFEPKPRKRL